MRIDDVDGLIKELCSAYTDSDGIPLAMTPHARIRAIVPKYVVRDEEVIPSNDTCADVREIVTAYLKANGYDGLWSLDQDEPCYCSINEIMPCGVDCMSECKPAHNDHNGTGPVL